MAWNQAKFDGAYANAVRLGESMSLDELEASYDACQAVNEVEVGWRDGVFDVLAKHDEMRAAKFLFRTDSDMQTRQTIESALARGDAEWIHDPEHVGVCGVVLTGTRRALLVVYVEDMDFEVTEEFEQMPAGDGTPYGKGGDWCPWCGSDWKSDHERNCNRPLTAEEMEEYGGAMASDDPDQP